MRERDSFAMVFFVVANLSLCGQWPNENLFDVRATTSRIPSIHIQGNVVIVSPHLSDSPTPSISTTSMAWHQWLCTLHRHSSCRRHAVCTIAVLLLFPRRVSSRGRGFWGSGHWVWANKSVASTYCLLLSYQSLLRGS